MTQISAANNLIIDPNPTRWRLLVNSNFVDNIQGDGVLMEASMGEVLRYTSVFARTRNLPKAGELPTKYIRRVVLGWSGNDEAWHLGLLLAAPLAEARQSRWCEIASWPDPEREIYVEDATEAGETLAQALGCPFNRLAPPEPTTEPIAVEVPLPPLPLDLQEWAVGKAQQTGWIVMVREPRWTRERWRRVGWYGFWAVIYVILAVATLTTDISPPRITLPGGTILPETTLPYLGLATAVLLAGLVAYSLYELRTKARRIILDPTTKRIWGTTHRSGKPVWRMGREQVDSVYVSEVVQLHVSDEDAVATDLFYGEINLRLTDGTYYFLLRQAAEETVARPMPGTVGEVQPLGRDGITTKLQATAAYVADGLNVPLWYDCRSK